MRLIDADNITYESIDSSDTVREEIKSGCGILAVRKEDIDVMPTIEERKTGKWILMSDADGKYYACSVCGNELQRYSTELPTWEKPYPHKQSIDKTDFCPSCGARMEGNT